jgi:hypothetical protein
MAEVNFDTLRAIYTLAQEKAEYDRTAKDWKRPAGIAGLLARRPVDPYPAGMSDLMTVFSVAFDGAFPQMDRYDAGLSGPSDSHARMSVSLNQDGTVNGTYRCSSQSSNTFHDEFFFLKPGYGLVHSYSHSDDPQQDAANRNYAFSNAMNTRYRGDRFFEKMDAAMDEVRRKMSELMAPVAYSRRQQLAAVEDARAFMQERKESMDSVIKKAAEKVQEPVSLRSYVDIKTQNLILANDVLSKKRSNTEFSRMVYSITNDKLLNFEREKVADLVARSVKSSSTPDELMAFSKLSYEIDRGKNPDLPENKIDSLHWFAELARKDGMERNSILVCVEKEAARYGVEFGPAQRKKIEDAIQEVDFQRVNALSDALRKNVFENGVLQPETVLDRFISDENNQVPGVKRYFADVVGTTEVMSRILERNDLKENRKFPYDAVARQLVDMGEVRFDPVVYASAILAARGQSVDVVRRMGNESQPVANLRGSMAQVLADDFTKFLSKKTPSQGDAYIKAYEMPDKALVGRWESSRRELSTPVTLLAREMYAASVAMATKDPASLGYFLYRNGISVKGVGVDDSFIEAARRMYGSAASMNEVPEAVLAFRKDYAEQIAQGKALISADRDAVASVKDMRQDNVQEKALDPKVSALVYNQYSYGGVLVSGKLLAEVNEAQFRASKDNLKEALSSMADALYTDKDKAGMLKRSFEAWDGPDGYSRYRADSAQLLMKQAFEKCEGLKNDCYVMNEGRMAVEEIVRVFGKDGEKGEQQFFAFGGESEKLYGHKFSPRLNDPELQIFLEREFDSSLVSYRSDGKVQQNGDEMVYARVKPEDIKEGRVVALDAAGFKSGKDYGVHTTPSGENFLLVNGSAVQVPKEGLMMVKRNSDGKVSSMPEAVFKSVYTPTKEGVCVRNQTAVRKEKPGLGLKK